MTDRIAKLRHESEHLPPRISINRAELYTKAYELYEGRVSTPELRALALKHFFTHCDLHIGENELIVGEKGGFPQAAPTFPELCCHTLDDLRVLNDRDLISFKVDERAFSVMKERVIPYFSGRSMREKILAAMSPEWRASYSAGIFTEFMEQRGPGHTVGSGVIYEKGFLDFQREIDAAITALDYINDPEAPDKREQLSAMRIACDAVMILGGRYAEYAENLADLCNSPVRKAELKTIAENCRIVPSRAPKNFWQAIQMYWFIHLAVTSEINPWDAYSPGRLDQHLLPFYNNITREFAQELLSCLWIKFNNQPAPPKVGVTLKESGTYTDFANINTGGITPSGDDGVNDVSYIILDVMDDMRLLQPSSNVQISEKNPDAFIKRACEISRRGWGQPAFYNTEAIVQELLNAGKSLDDARLGGASGCVETGAFGLEAYILTGYFNLPKILEITLNGGVDPLTGECIGAKTDADFSSFDNLYEAFERQLRHFLAIKIAGSNCIERLYMKHMPVPFLSVITRDCIENGRDYNCGGARYNTNYIQGVGIGTIADCLAAIKKHVYDEHTISLGALNFALKNNFSDNEILRAKLKNRSPRYGNDDEYADEWMRRVFKSYRSAVMGHSSPRGAEYRVNMLPTTCHVYFGEKCIASANGRLAHTPLSEGISPTQGADTHGPTAVIRSAAKMDQLSTGGTLLNQKFTPAAVEGDAGLDNMAHLIRAYFALNGHHIQFNVLDRQVLLDAQAHPDEYKGLIVRVAGYSDYFENLSRGLQDEIIARTEQGF